ncbi:Acetyl esterase Axe7A precursor [Anatilimnocola aggregata]|uniref:Acetyl esterase Axe7A n=1 Tax=Anatilimnocola aggregata TaxID=2528021 RepID=A0A517YMZ8_9BACT|nr:alpha/beta fold hydrolase [Anatilimnocola aggregata]QDU31599.1 Acetyl esterase Axe7A precursor [Anatilimnocola aggregata]
MKQVLSACFLYLFVASVSPALAEPGKLPATSPWDLKKLNEAPKFEWVSETEPVRSLFYESEPYGGKPTRVFAYYASPNTLTNARSDQKFPAMVLVHGGGGTAFREWAELWAKRGYAAIAMDLAGHQPMEGKNAHQQANRTRLADGGPNQGDEEKFGSVLKEPGEQWPYHAVAAVIRAHSLIRSFPEVDAEKTGVTGISWGGYLTCIVSGVDNRFKAAVPVYGCGFLQENSAWTDRMKKMTDEQSTRWTQLWDPKQYLPAVSMPILFVNGTNDFAYPIDSYMKSYDAVPGEKQMRMTVNMPHGHPPGWLPQEIGLFIDQHLIGGKALPKLADPKLDGKQVTAHCEHATGLKEAAVHYSTDGGPINKRTWKSVPAKIDGDQIIAPALPGDAAVWFLTVTDDRGAIVSTRVVVK